MNRIRTIATAGIVAGSVAFAAALLSSGGVGASFVDAAEASTSITVANHLDGLEPEGCSFTIHVGHKEIDVNDLLDLSQFGEYDDDGNFTATFDFDVSSPNFTALWAIALSGGLHATWSQHGNTLSVTFTWSLTGGHLEGSAAITLTCTPQSDGQSGSGNGDHPHTWSKLSQNNFNALAAPDGSVTQGVPTNSGDAQPQIISLQAVLDVPAGNDPDAACETPTGESSPAASCAPQEPTQPDCTPDGADVSDTEKCPPANDPPPPADPAAPPESDPEPPAILDPPALNPSEPPSAEDQ